MHVRSCFCLQVCCFLAWCVMQCKKDSKSHDIMYNFLHASLETITMKAQHEELNCVNMYLSD